MAKRINLHVNIFVAKSAFGCTSYALTRRHPLTNKGNKYHRKIDKENTIGGIVGIKRNQSITFAAPVMVIAQSVWLVNLFSHLIMLRCCSAVNAFACDSIKPPSIKLNACCSNNWGCLKNNKNYLFLGTFLEHILHGNLENKIQSKL